MVANIDLVKNKAPPSFIDGSKFLINKKIINSFYFTQK
jgi:hypothetical protein